MIVPADSIGAERAAARAAMDDRPLAVLADFDRDGFHGLAAGAAPIARLFVEVARPEAARAVVAMGCAEGLGRHVVLADDAGEGRVGLRFV